MLFRVALLVVLLAICSASKYGRKGKRGRVICSGAEVGDLNLNLEELRGRWFNKFFKVTIPGPSSRPNNITIDFEVPKNGLRALDILSGNDPVDGSCVVWTARDFQIFDNEVCIAEKGVDPEGCVDEEWVHYIFGSKRHLLLFYYCKDKNPGPYCDQFLVRCLSRTPRISHRDRRDCQAMFDRFNVGELPDEDNGSSNNACDGNGPETTWG